MREFRRPLTAMKRDKDKSDGGNRLGRQHGRYSPILYSPKGKDQQPTDNSISDKEKEQLTISQRTVLRAAKLTKQRIRQSPKQALKDETQLKQRTRPKTSKKLKFDRDSLIVPDSSQTLDP